MNKGSRPRPRISSWIVWTAFILLICPGSAVALFLVIPWTKEGYGIEQLPLFAGVAGGFV